MKKFLALLLLIPLTACQATNETNSPVAAQNVQQGLSIERLARIEPAMQQYIDQKKLAGVMTLVARNGEIVHWHSQGLQDIEKQTPLAKDTIFRIYSMSKPRTAVAALTLWEQGKFHMHD